MNADLRLESARMKNPKIFGGHRGTDRYTRRVAPTFMKFHYARLCGRLLQKRIPALAPRIPRWRGWILAWCGLAAIPSSGVGQGTAFTYQGRLNDGALAATGVYDLRFAVYATETGGAAVGGPTTNAAVSITNGLFTVPLDFGPAFTGAPRWLEIGVRPGGSASDFTTLEPRQPLRPTPYAMFANTAGGVPNGAITAAQLAAGAAEANLSAGGQAAVGGGGVVLSEQFNAAELLSAGYVKMGRANLIDEAWTPGAAGPTGLPPVLARRGHSAIWTGAEMIIWGGVDKNGLLLNTGARYNPAAGTWVRINTTNAPAPRANHRAVWTGTEMIVWGGLASGFFATSVTNTGGRYNPATDAWTPIAAGGGSRQSHSAFWTGTEMLVWGGTAISSGLFGGGSFPLNSGARYNLAANNWTVISSSGSPVPRFDYSAVFTGPEMIIWGGRDCVGSFLCTETNYNDGFRYNLAANTWTPLSLVGAPARRFGHAAVWSGSEMLVWGGQYREGFFDVVSSNFNNGARYNPAANTWTALPTLGAPAARFGHDAVWAGNRLVIWGGTDGTNGYFDSGARYFPGPNAWSNMTFTARPAGRTGHTTVWSGSEMIVWGGFNEFIRDLGARYHPSNDVWTVTPPTGERSERRGHSAIWTGTEVLVWGGFDGERFVNTGGRYVPSANAWTPLPTNNAPSARAAHSAVWTGTEMIIWGGSGPGFLNTGARFNPATGTWSPLSTTGAPTPRNNHAAVWDGTRLIVWGGFDGSFLNNGGRYNPVNNTWVGLSAAGAPAARSGASAVWTGTEMLVWGGVGGTLASQVPLSTGARYLASANSWAALPTSNAPAARTGHRAVWTGDELLVWGGTDLTTNLGSGGRYQRTLNQWGPLPTNGAPSPRVEHSAVWDGTRMAIWGGRNGEIFLRDGAIFNPRTDAWQAILVNGTNSPPGRAQHAAVWTGSEMVIDGGYVEGALPGSTDFLDDTWQHTPPRTMFLYLKP